MSDLLTLKYKELNATIEKSLSYQEAVQKLMKEIMRLEKEGEDGNT